MTLAKISSLLAMATLIWSSIIGQNDTKKVSQILLDMVQALGGLDKYQELKDVTYTYTYRDLVTGAQDVSIEKYLYEGELSWGKYTEHTKNVATDKEGPITQAWNGKEAWLIQEGNFVPAPPALRMVKFARETSFFWFNMMYKLVDPGTRYQVLPNRAFDEKEYLVVEVSYDEGIGDAQDRFILYLNPHSKLVEHFLFSNAFFSKEAPPRMMHIEYQNVQGLKFPKRQWYESADWDGNIVERPGPNPSEKVYTNIQFNSGIDKSLFDKPILTEIPLADIRNAHLKRGIQATDREKGKALIRKLEEACGGYQKWRSHDSANFIQSADWYDNETNWTTNPQDFEMTCVVGGSDGELTLLNGPKAGTRWIIRNGVTLTHDGLIDQENHAMVWHKQDYKSYWFQFPFKIREADLISYAGQREIEGTTYNIVYATWHSEEPNSRYDQFMLYLNPETNLLEWLEFTIRDIFPMATGISQFTNFQERNGIKLPMSQFLTMGTLDNPMKKLHENHYKNFRFSH